MEHRVTKVRLKELGFNVVFNLLDVIWRGWGEVVFFDDPSVARVEPFLWVALSVRYKINRF